MTTPLGVNEFFVLEAGEYLDRLASLVAGPAAPPADELLRSARALRGSALMASQAPIARAAGGLEALIRAVRENRRPWDAAAAGAASEAVVEIKSYLTHLSRWTDTDSAAAEALAVRLEVVAGVPTRPAPGAAATSDTGTRAFVAREGAAVASVLDQAGRILRAGPGSREALQAALARTQPLRGLAALADYPPLAEILDAVELTAADVERGDLDGPTAAGVLDAAARAMSRAARDVLERGRPDTEASETRQLGDLLAGIRRAIPPIIPIDDLFPDDGQPGIVQTGPAPAPGRAEMVSRGERLRQVADDLEKAGSPAQRALRLHMVAQDLRAIAVGIAGDLGHRLHRFGRQVLEAIAQGETGRLAPHLRRAGELLQGYDESAAAGRLIERLKDLTVAVLAPAPPTGQMRAIVIPEPVAAAPEPAAPLEPAAPARDPDLDLPIVPIESLLYDEIEARPAPVPELPIVPIAELAPDVELAPELVPDLSLSLPPDLASEYALEPERDAAEPVPIAVAPLVTASVAAPPAAPSPVAPPAAEADAADLAGSFLTYSRLVVELGLAGPSLEQLIKGTPRAAHPAVTAPAAVPVVATPVAPPPVAATPTIRAPAPEPVTPVKAFTPVVPSAPVARAEPEVEVVEIATLCYRGRGALERAAVVRDQIRVARSADATAGVVDPLVEELLDLVELALVESA
jgi:hypothetical protein